MLSKQFLRVWPVAATLTLIITVTAQPQSKPVAPAITVYQDPT